MNQNPSSHRTIISASRRTDIPAFYTPWFLNRLKEGYALYKHPFTGKIFRVSLKAEDVHSIVFWSRDYEKLIPHLKALQEKGYRFYFHFTLTGHPRILDPNVVPPKKAIRQFQDLSQMFSPDHVQWRFDPLIITDVTPVEQLFSTFTRLAGKLKDATRRCTISFAHLYGKVIRNLKKLDQERGVKHHEIPDEEKYETAQKIAEIAADHGMRVYSCCCPNLVGGLVQQACCIDGEVLRSLFPERILRGKVTPTRKGCGCFTSRDIGAYNTCPQGCVYCYANANPAIGAKSLKNHQPTSPSLP
jgi:DNA repair photolyase